MNPKIKIAILCMFVVLIYGYGIKLRIAPKDIFVTIRQEGKKEIFRDPDSYRFYRQAKIIIEEGSLPDVDKMRWLPTGRNLRTHLNFSSYIMASFYWISRPFKIDLYTIALFYSVLCFVLSVPIFYLLAREISRHIAIISTFIYAVVPHGIPRTSVGYCDRDAICLVFILLAFFFFIRSLKTNGVLGYVYELAAGVSLGMLGLTWEAVGVFVAIVVITRIILNLNQNKIDWKRHLVFLFPVVAICLLGTDAYKGGGNPSTPIGTILWGSVLLLIVSLIIQWGGGRFFSSWGGYRRKLGIVAISFMVCAGVILSINGYHVLKDLIQNAHSTLGNSKLMQSVAELQDYNYEMLIQEFKFMFILFVAGLGLMYYHLTSSKMRTGVFLCATPFFIIADIPFIPQHISRLVTDILLVGILISLIVTSYKHVKHSFILLLSIIYTIVVLILTKGALRYVYFLTPSTAIAIGYLLYRCAEYAKLPKYILPSLFLGVFLLQPLFLPKEIEWIILTTTIGLAVGWYISIALLYKSNIPSKIMYSSYIIFLLLTVFSFMGVFLGAGGGSMVFAYKRFMPNIMPAPEVYKAFVWMRQNTPPDAIVVSSWDTGSMINVLAERATVVDEDHLYPERIYSTYRHVYCAQTEKEVVNFCKDNNITHILVESSGVRNGELYSYLGSNSQGDRSFDISVFNTSRSITKTYKFFSNSPMSTIQRIVMDFNSIALFPQQIKGITENDKEISFDNIIWNENIIHSGKNKSGYSLIAFCQKKDNRIIFEMYAMRNVGFNSLAVRLLLRDGYPSLKKIYEKKNPLWQLPLVQIWEVNNLR